MAKKTIRTQTALPYKRQRIRDPVHNLIEFETDEFEQTIWRVIGTPTFQRLRRIRQLGFSEFVYPGATHTRFGHSLGVFHTARNLMETIRSHVRRSSSHPFGEMHSRVALAAALLHDVGHGMFSHAFESLAKELQMTGARHENVSQYLIKNSEISDILNKELGSGFANDVANLIAPKEPGSLYDAVVSSQFDADRLDYMQRDRLFSGVQSSGIDFRWLTANLEVASIRTGADEESTGSIDTLVLGPKAIQGAESYVIALFHLYVNVYFHKTTRAAEAVFKGIMRRLIEICKDGNATRARTGLHSKHPLVLFATDPNSVDRALRLDDMVFWAGLPELAQASDPAISRLGQAMLTRRLPECIDVRLYVEEHLPSIGREKRPRRLARIGLACSNIESALRLLVVTGGAENSSRLMLDRVNRQPYERYQDSKTPLNRILIRQGSGSPQDVAELSPIIAAAERFEGLRAYVLRGDTEMRDKVRNIMRTEVERSQRGRP